MRATALRRSRTKRSAAAGLRVRYQFSAAQVSSWASTRNLTGTGTTPPIEETFLYLAPGNRLGPTGVQGIQPTIDLPAPGGFGIPINVVPASQAKVPIVFDQYEDESDPGPYPFPGPTSIRVEGTDDPTSCDGDCHVIVVQQGTCQVYEGYACHYASTGWICGNGAHWDLTRNSQGQRPDGWTSVDAAGLSIYAGLARYEEVKSGAVVPRPGADLGALARDSGAISVEEYAQWQRKEALRKNVIKVDDFPQDFGRAEIVRSSQDELREKPVSARAA